jgi:hypothetical protein
MSPADNRAARDDCEGFAGGRSRPVERAFLAWAVRGTTSA